MADGITYGGHNLLLDLDSQLQDFLDDWLTQDVACPVVPLPIADERADSRTDRFPGGAGAKLSIPNYPPTPRIGINQLYWPTGALRHARGYFLADETTVLKLRTEAYDLNQPVSRQVNSPLPLVIDYGSDIVEAIMYMLAPRPLSAIIGERVWLIPLVDERYWWKTMGVGASYRNGNPAPVNLPKKTPLTTWNILIQTIGQSINSGIGVGSIPAAYGHPDPVELSRHFESVAAMLDAIAHSLGRRVVRDLNGFVRLMDHGTSAGRATANGNRQWEMIAGGEYVPAPDANRLLVAFSRSVGCEGDPEKPWHWVDVPNVVDANDPADFSVFDETCNPFSEGNASGTPGVSDVIYSSFYARFEKADDACPSNQAAVAAIAKQIAFDYYRYKEADRTDATFAGLPNWQLTAYDDFALYDFGTEGKPRPKIVVVPAEADEETPPPVLEQVRQRRLTTRIRSMPQDFGAQHQLSQDENVPIPNPSRGRNNLLGKPKTSEHVTNTWHEYVLYQLTESGPAEPYDPEQTLECWQESGFPFSPNNLHHIWEGPSDCVNPELTHWSHPHPFQDCETASGDSNHSVATNTIMVGPNFTHSNSDESVGIGDGVSLTNSDSSVVMGVLGGVGRRLQRHSRRRSLGGG